MGMASTGIIRAEGQIVTSALSTDEVLIQRIDSTTGQRAGYMISLQNLLTTIPTGFTQGSVVFADANGDLAQDNTNFNYNSSTFALTVGGAIAASGALSGTTITGTGDLTVNSGNIIANTAGKGLRVKAGSNARIGTSTLSAGTVVVSNTSVTSSTRIFLTVQSLGTVAAPKAIAVTAVSAGTSFTITSSDNTDTSVVAWMLVESI